MENFIFKNGDRVEHINRGKGTFIEYEFKGFTEKDDEAFVQFDENSDAEGETLCVTVGCLKLLTNEATLVIPLEWYIRHQSLLDMTEKEFIEFSCESGAIFGVYTAHFENGYKGQIRIVSRDIGVVAEALLHTEDDNNLMLLTKSDNILGEYNFEFPKITYTLRVKTEAGKVTQEIKRTVYSDAEVSYNENGEVIYYEVLRDNDVTDLEVLKIQ